jgi:hypothetical protein
MGGEKHLDVDSRAHNGAMGLLTRTWGSYFILCRLGGTRLYLTPLNDWCQPGTSNHMVNSELRPYLSSSRLSTHPSCVYNRSL